MPSTNDVRNPALARSEDSITLTVRLTGCSVAEAGMLEARLRGAFADLQPSVWRDVANEKPLPSAIRIAFEGPVRWKPLPAEVRQQAHQLLESGLALFDDCHIVIGS